MTSNPIRLLARLLVALAALALAVGVAPTAEAQSLGDLEVDSADANTQADPEEHEDTFQVGRGIHFIRPDIQPGDGGATGGTGGATGGTGGGDAGAGLAVTGTDVEPIVAISAGMLALGGAALVASRRRLRAI